MSEVISDLFDKPAEAAKPDVVSDLFSASPTPKPNPLANFFSAVQAQAAKGPIQQRVLNEANVKQAFGDRGLAAADSITQGMTGIAPKYQDLQQKYPVQSFATEAVAGVVPYLFPAGGMIAKFTAIPAVHEIARQLTTPEDLNSTQRVGKVATAGALGFATGKMFESADLLKTVAARVAAKAGAGGSTAAVNSVAQDVESGRDPDLKSAITNAAVNAGTIGLLGAAVELPELRSAVVQEGSRWAGKPVDFEQAKKILTSGGVNVEELSPTLRNAITQNKRASLMKGAQKTADSLGVPRSTVVDVMKDRTVQDRLRTIDEQIYGKVKTATGRTPYQVQNQDGTTDWQYDWDYSKMNPAAAEQLQTLTAARKAIAAGADPAEVLWNAQVAKQINVKQYISETVKAETRNMKSLYDQQIKTAEAPQEKPVNFFNPGKIESVGEKESLNVYKPLSGGETLNYLPYIQKALDNIRASEQQKPPDQQRPVPNAGDLNHIQRDQLLKDVQMGVLANTSESDLVGKLEQKLNPDDTNLKHEVSVLTSHQGKEDAAKTPIYDWRNQRNITIAEYAADLKQLNDKRAAAGLPVVDPAKDITVHRAIYRGQSGGAAKQVREAILREYNRTKVSQLKVIPDLFQQPTLDQATTQIAGKINNPTAMPTPTPAVDVITSNSGYNLPVGSQDIMQQQDNGDANASQQALTSTSKSIPTVLTGEEVHESIRKTHTKLIRNEVVQASSAESLAQLANGMKLTGTPEEKMSQLAKAAGITVQDVLTIMHNTSSWADVAMKDKESMAYELSLDMKQDLTIELTAIVDKLKDWYEGISAVPYEQAMEELLAEQAKKSMRKTKGVKSPDVFKKTQAQKYNDERAQNLSKMSKDLEKHRGYIGEVYLGEIKAAMDGLSSKAKGIMETPLAAVAKDASPDHLLAVIKTLTDHIITNIDNVGEMDQQTSDEEPQHYEEFEGENEAPWTDSESGQMRLPGLPLKIKILKHTDAERDAPMFQVFKTIRNFPFVSNLREHFILKYNQQKKESELRNFFKVADEAQSALINTAKYLDAVRSLAHEDLQPIDEDVLKNIKEWMKAAGMKTDKAATEERYNALMSLLMPHASESIIVRSFDPNNYGFSMLGQGPHGSAQETDSYVRHVQKAYQYFKIPQQDQLSEADLRKSRTPVFWDLLKHPNVMHNDSLQRAVRFWKAQIEQVAYDNQIKEGIFGNADVVKAYIQGYHKASYVMKGAQVNTSGSRSGNPLEGIQKPSKKYRSHAEFLDRADTEGLIPVNDWMKDNFDYLVDAMASIKQAQLLKMVGKIQLPAIEYESPEFIKALKDNPTKAKFHIIEHSTNSNIIEEAERMTKLMGYEVTPHRVLQEGGWREGNAEWGLNKWYRGGFAPPFIYKPFAEQIRTLFRNQNRAENALSNVAKFSQHLLTMSALDNLTYLGATTLERPAWKVVSYIGMLFPRAVGHFMKGVVSTGPKIAKGEHSSSVGKNDYQKAWARIFTEEGSTATHGFKTFMRHLVDMNDRGLFPHRQGKADNLKDWYLSAFGTSEEIIGEMIANDILQAMIRIAENEVSKGRSVREAAKFTAEYMNNASWNIHRVAYQGSFSNFLQDYLVISRNFLVNLIRVPMIIGKATPVGKAIGKKTGAFNFKTAGGAGGALGEFQNVLTAADIPAEYTDALAWKYTGMLGGLIFWSLLINGMTQYAIALMHHRKDKENFFENPEGMTGKVWSGVQDPNGHDLYFSNGLFKMVNNMNDMWAPLLDPMERFLTGNPDIHGQGPLKVASSKLGFIPNLSEALLGSNFLGDGSKIYDPSPDAWAQNAVRFLNKAGEGTLPSNPWLGSGKIPYEYSADSIENALIKTSTLFGFNVSRSYDQYFKDWQDKVASERFKQDETRKEIHTVQQAADALRNGKITTSAFRQKMQQTSNPALYFFKRNKNLINRPESD